MILTKTPFRMSFVGGGSDLPVFYRESEGAVISSTIDKYVYVAVNRKFDTRVRLSYSKTEDVLNSSEVEHPLVRSSLEMLRITGGIEISSIADIPSKGSGLGSSSSFTVGLLNALYCLKKINISKLNLAMKACEIEIDLCNEPIGKQDQYAASVGGINLIRFLPNNTVIVEPINSMPEKIKRLEESILVFYTGLTRRTAEILGKHIEVPPTSKEFYSMRKMVELCYEFKKELENGEIKNLGQILHESWMKKIEINDKVITPEISDYYQKGILAGAHGGKILGAGSGGFLMFIAPIQNHELIKRALSKLRPMDINFENYGTQIVYET
jgi:D-glycero-alpha-D-manno-heptose-7-phosphate kinase